MIKRVKEKALAYAAAHKPLLLKAAFGVGAAGLAVFFLLFGPPHLIEHTETPQFCGLCHSMKPQHSAWEHSAHRTARCIDCHLPNDNAVNHYFWKTIDGNKDVFFEFSGLREHDEIKLSGHAKKVLQANCLRCHAEMVSRIGTDRSCTDCHRRTGHRGQAVRITTEGLR